MLACDGDLGAADVLLMPHTHPVLAAQTTIDGLVSGEHADFALYAGAAPGCRTVLADIRLLAQWLMSVVEQTQIDSYLLGDISRAVTLHRQSTSWPHGRYWMSAGVVPAVLDTAVGVSLALHVISLPDISGAVSALQRLKERAHNGGSYRRPISRRAELSPAVRSVLDVVSAGDNADRKLFSRLARQLASSHSEAQILPVLAR